MGINATFPSPTVSPLAFLSLACPALMDFGSVASPSVHMIRDSDLSLPDQVHGTQFIHFVVSFLCQSGHRRESFHLSTAGPPHTQKHIPPPPCMINYVKWTMTVRSSQFIVIVMDIISVTGPLQLLSLLLFLIGLVKGAPVGDYWSTHCVGHHVSQWEDISRDTGSHYITALSSADIIAPFFPFSFFPASPFFPFYIVFLHLEPWNTGTRLPVF